jgi:hypothetical protein
MELCPGRTRPATLRTQLAAPQWAYDYEPYGALRAATDVLEIWRSSAVACA